MIWNRRRSVALGSLLALGFLLLPAAAADACSRCRGDFGISFHYSRHRHYDDDWCEPRYRRSYRSYSVRTYVPVRRYRCGCGAGFASSYWLSYHRRHSDCDW